MPKFEFHYRKIASMEAPENPTVYYDTKESGLILRLSKAGTKTFCYRYYFNGKKRRFTIGKFPAVSLSEARNEVQRLKVEVNDGIDPQAEKNKRKYQPEHKNFKEVAAYFQERHLPTLRQSTQKEYNRIIENELLPALKNIQVSNITSHHVRKILDDKAINDGSPTMANRIRAVLSSIFNFALQRGVTKENPVESTSRFKAGENKRDRVYNENEIQELWSFFEQLDEPIQSVMKILLLTAQRKTETMRMKWDDIKYDKPYKRTRRVEGKEVTEAFPVTVWTIPAENAKNKKEHEVPLSDEALQIIEDLRPLTGESDYVFESPRVENKPIKWLKSSAQLIQKHSDVTDFRLHDLRRTAASYMGESRINHMVIGKVLNHKGMAKENTITARYNRHKYMDEKQNALNRWSDRLQNILTDETEATITKIG